MKYFLLCVFFILFNIKSVQAKVGTISLDTSIDKSSYKQSKQYFLEHYGKDDSTKAIIKYFFSKRRDAVLETVIPAVAAGIAAALIARVTYVNNHNTSNKRSGYGGLIIVGPAAIVLFYSPVILLIGQVKWLRFSRHKLLKTIIDYNSGKPLPRRITRRKQFRNELERLTH